MAVGPFFLWIHLVDPARSASSLPKAYAAPFIVDGHYELTKLRLSEDDNNFHGGVACKYRSTQ